MHFHDQEIMHFNPAVKFSLTVFSDALPMNSWYGLSEQYTNTHTAGLRAVSHWWNIYTAFMRRWWDHSISRKNRKLHTLLSVKTNKGMSWEKERDSSKSTVILTRFYSNFTMICLPWHLPWHLLIDLLLCVLSHMQGDEVLTVIKMKAQWPAWQPLNVWVTVLLFVCVCACVCVCVSVISFLCRMFH